MRALLSVAYFLVVPAALADPHVELNLFGSSSSASFGFGIHTHHRRPRQPVVQPPPVVVYQQPTYAAPPAVMAPPPLLQAPPPVVVAPAPVYVQPPARVVTRPAPPPTPDRPALIGLKYTPGLSGVFTSSSNSVGFVGARFVHSAGLEVRLSNWFALRSDIEFRNDSRSFDVIGAKVWLAGASWTAKPYLSASLSGTVLDATPNALTVGMVGAGGLDIFFGKNFFIEAEVRYRVLPGSCCTDVPQLTGAAGIGVAFL